MYNLPPRLIFIQRNNLGGGRKIFAIIEVIYLCQIIEYLPILSNYKKALKTQ